VATGWAWRRVSSIAKSLPCHGSSSPEFFLAVERQKEKRSRPFAEWEEELSVPGRTKTRLSRQSTAKGCCPQGLAISLCSQVVVYMVWLKQRN
jgi:hypothetical protein